jgi:hypothetical protein
MTSKAPNRNLQDAQKAREDEFYTQLGDIERELRHYKSHFKGKVVYCNCDDPWVSNFFHYFSYNFEKLGLKKLITTCYRSQHADLFSQNDSEHAIYLEYDGDANNNNVPDPEEIGVKSLKGDGDFRSAETIELLKQADIVVTNPPFSLFREYLGQLVGHDKKFLILGNLNAITHSHRGREAYGRDVFLLLRDNKLWLGYNNGQMAFKVPDYYELRVPLADADHPWRATGVWQDEDGQKWRSFGNMCWFTNLDLSKRHEDLILYRSYDETAYPNYDNYDAIHVNKVADIPMDFDGVMGVPITFLNKHNPDQFEIVGLIAGNIKGLAGIPSSTGKDGPYVGGKVPESPADLGEHADKLRYGRILIRNKRL